MSKFQRFTKVFAASKNIGFAESKRHGLMLAASATLGVGWAAGLVTQPWAYEHGVIAMIGLACCSFAGIGLVSYLLMVHVSGLRRLNRIGQAYGEIKREQALDYYAIPQDSPFLPSKCHHNN